MTSRTRVVVATFWILSLFAVGQLTRAQGDPMTLQQPVLYTGSDIGVRVTQPKSGGSNLCNDCNSGRGSLAGSRYPASQLKIARSGMPRFRSELRSCQF